MRGETPVFRHRLIISGLKEGVQFLQQAAIERDWK
jgi:hypothetical protein